MDLKYIALNDVHVELGAKMMPFAGYNMPVRYSSGVEEHLAVRQNVGIFDVSHMGEFMVEGPNALQLLQKVTSNDVSKLEIGQAQYSCLPNQQGGIVDDLLVYYMAQNKYMLVVNASNIQKDWDWIVNHNDMGATMTNISDDICLFAVQGPNATKALQSLTEVALEDISFYRFVEGTFGGVADVVISATGYTGSGGFELYVPAQSAVPVWNKIMQAGADLGIKPIGLGARDTLRLEKGYCLYGNDINDITSPLEAGLGWITKFTKDFVGKEIIQAQKEAGIKKKLVGFVMEERGIPRQHYLIKDADGNTIGEVTSGSQSPSLQQGIGLGYVESPFTAADSEIHIEIRNKLVKAQVKKLPLV